MNKEKQHNLANEIKNHYTKFGVILQHHEPYTLYSEKDLADIFDCKTIRGVTKDYNTEEKIKYTSLTKGGYQPMNYLTYNGLLKFLAKSTKKKYVDFIKLFNIDIKEINNNILNESKNIKYITGIFDEENIIKEYRVDEYIIDLYFVDYNLVIEFISNNSEENKIREEYIQKKLDCKFIKYNLCDKNSNIYNLLNDIYTFIYEYNLKNEITLKESLQDKIIKTSIKLQKQNEELEIKLNKLIPLELEVKEQKNINHQIALENQEMKEKIDKQKDIVEIIKNEQELMYQNPLIPENELTDKFDEFINKICIIRPDVEEQTTVLEGQFRIWLGNKPRKEIFHSLKNYLDTRFKPTRILVKKDKEQLVHGYIGIKLKSIDYKKKYPSNQVENFIFHACKFSPCGKISYATLNYEYQKWKTSLELQCSEEDIKEIKKYLNECEYVIKATVWTEEGSNEGYYGIMLKSDDVKPKNIASTTGKKVYKIENSTGDVLGNWNSIADAAQYESISRAKMSRSVKDKILFNNDYYYSTENKN